jgi:signal transduction histidine kinase
MGNMDLIARLAEHRSIGTAPPEERVWLAAHGSPRTYRTGDVLTARRQREEWLQIVLSGRVAIHADRGAGSRKLAEWRGGDVCGLLPYSRGGSPPGDVVAEEDTDTLAVPRDQISAMIHDCPHVTATLVHAMLDRARHLTSSDLHDEKLLSLGRLAAGLAHELNNPASAASRGAQRLAAAQARADRAARALGAERLSAPQLAAIDRLHDLCVTATSPAALTAVDRADREDAVGAWLVSRGVDLDETTAALLAEADAPAAALDALADVIPGAPFRAALQWIAAACAVRQLAADIETAASRIADLVSAVKGFTYMDRAPTPESLDIRPGLRDTLAVLSAKTRAKSVGVSVTFAEDLPRVQAFGGELNQVWGNLIDNALDAVGPGGHVDVSAARDHDRLVVSIVDDGPGIPPDVQERIFDPFFTTKPVGQGTGLGLDIVRRLVQRHDGEIDVTSTPGRTEFRVSLPATNNQQPTTNHSH